VSNPTPLLSWKRRPPGSPEEAEAAALLKVIGPAPTLPPEAIERIAHRVHARGSLRGQRRRRLPLFDSRIALLAAGVATLGILIALVTLALLGLW
jgi:hypothetical protein